MKIFIQSTIRFFLFVTAVLILGGILPSFAADLQMFSNARLINDPANDGDSFLVEANGKSYHVRLYFVDCPETLIAFTSDAQRVREQTRYFGLPDAKRTIHFGNEGHKRFRFQRYCRELTRATQHISTESTKQEAICFREGIRQYCVTGTSICLPSSNTFFLTL